MKCLCRLIDARDAIKCLPKAKLEVNLRLAIQKNYLKENCSEEDAVSLP